MGVESLILTNPANCRPRHVRVRIRVRLYSYIVASDTGFAPNPFWGYCTLATCKPGIRRTAETGDWIIGGGSSKNVGHGKLIYAMKVTEPPLSFEEYDKDPRFQKKRPRQDSGLRLTRGDNIYYRTKKGVWRQRTSRHTDKNMRKDLGGKRVLVSRYFWYFGRNAPRVPQRFQELMFTGRNYKIRFPKKLVQEFLVWLKENHRRGVRGVPCQDWEEARGRPCGRCEKTE